MSEYIRQNLKIIKSVYDSVDRLSMETINFFIENDAITEGVIWSDGRDILPAGLKHPRWGKLTKIVKLGKSIPKLQFHFATQPMGEERVLTVSELRTDEKQLIASLLILKFLKK